MAGPVQNGRVRELTHEEAWELLEERTRQRLHIGAQEFIDRWLAGAYGEPDDNRTRLRSPCSSPVLG